MSSTVVNAARAALLSDSSLLFSDASTSIALAVVSSVAESSRGATPSPRMAFISFSFSAASTRSHRPSRSFSKRSRASRAAASASPSWTTSRVRRSTSALDFFASARDSSNSLRNRVSRLALSSSRCDRSPDISSSNCNAFTASSLSRNAISASASLCFARLDSSSNFAARRVASAAACPSAACTASRRFNSFNSSIVSSSFARRFLATRSPASTAC